MKKINLQLFQALLIFNCFLFLPFSYAKDYKWKMATSWSGGVNFEVGAKAFAKKSSISLMERSIFKPSLVAPLVKRLKSLARLKMGSPNWSLLDGL